MSSNSKLELKTDIKSNKDVPDYQIGNQILDHLYLGDLAAGQSELYLLENKIETIICITLFDERRFVNAKTSYWIEMDDDGTTCIIDKFTKFIHIIDEKVEAKESVLVHCKFCRSRSASLIIAYLISKYKMSAQQALKFVQEKRPFVNPLFMEQLIKHQDYFNSLL